MKILFLCCVAAAGFAQTAPVADYQVSGIVVDHLTNRPLSHVLVQLDLVGKSNGSSDASVLTTDDGRFLFMHVPLGKYRLTAEKRRQRAQSFHGDGPYATAIVVDGRHKTAGLVFALRTDDSLTGTVIGDDGEPVGNAQIHLFKESVTDGEAQTIHYRDALSNSLGEFHFGHLDAASYYVSANGIPWFTQPGAEVVYPMTFYGDATDAAHARVIDLAEGSSATLQITLHTVPSIRVNVSDMTRGVTLFAAGPGESRIPVKVSTQSVGTVVKRSSSVKTPAADQSQNAELVNLAAGRYEVMESGDGEMTTGHWVDLSDGSTLSLDAQPTAAVTGRLIVLDGPQPTGDFEILLGHANRTLTAEVSADGTFKFEKITAGTYPIHQSSPEILISSITAQGARMVSDKLEISSGSPVSLTIKAVTRKNLVTLEGLAINNGIGSSGAMVLLLPQDLDHARLVRRDQSDADGSFSLRDVIPGKYTLLAIDDGKDLAYKNPALIKPYLQGGVAITVPITSNDPIKVPVQTRKR